MATMIYVDESVYTALYSSGNSSVIDLSEINSKLDNINLALGYGTIDTSDPYATIKSDIYDIGYGIDNIDIDLTPLETKIDNIAIDFTPLETKIDNIDIDLTPLETKIDNINLDVSTLNNLDFISLNGASGSYKDGSVVNVVGYDKDYTIVSSQMLKNDQNVYIVVYIVKDVDDKRFLVPSTAVTLKV